MNDREPMADRAELPELLERNRGWAERTVAAEPDYFAKLSRQQSPKFLWVGCSDSRVPANQIVGLMPGEIFVHRNVANVVVHADLNCLSVLQFGIDVLKVEHVIVCGHYGCGGVGAVLRDERHGLCDNWLRHVRDVLELHRDHLHAIADPIRRFERLCELNVVEQVRNVCATTVVQDAWARGQALSVHGWIYGLRDGRLRDLGVGSTSYAAAERLYRQAVSGV